MRFAISASVLAALAACGGDHPAAPKAPIPRVIEVDNALALPISVAVDGVPYGGVQPSSFVVYTAPAGSRAISYTVAPVIIGGTPVSPEFSQESVELVSDSSTLVVNNFIAGVPYVAPAITNRTTFAYDLQISHSGVTQCVGTVPAASSQFNASATQFGYYRLDAGTELRIYAAGSKCVGRFAFWNYPQLANYTPNSGVVALSISTTP